MNQNHLNTSLKDKVLQSLGLPEEGFEGKIRLLSPSENSIRLDILLFMAEGKEKGYRMYSQQTVDRLHFIKRMQELGFTLNEIDKLLGVVDRDEAKCRDMYDFTILKIEDIQRKIEDLKRIERMLMDLKERCPENKDIYECPIIETLMKK